MLNSTKKKKRGQNSDKAVPIRFYEMASNGDFTFYAPLILHRRLSQHFARRDAYLLKIMQSISACDLNQLIRLKIESNTSISTFFTE